MSTNILPMKNMIMHDVDIILAEVWVETCDNDCNLTGVDKICLIAVFIAFCYL